MTNQTVGNQTETSINIWEVKHTSSMVSNVQPLSTVIGLANKSQFLAELVS